MAGRQFWGIANRQQVAALYSSAGIMCNSGRVAIYSITIRAKAAQQIMLIRTAGKPLANQYSAPVSNKRLAAAQSTTCELVGGTAAAYPPATPADYAAAYTSLGVLYLGGNDRERLNFNDSRSPLVLEAGQGIFAASNTVNLDLGFEVDFEELE
jgi:hypothetical protein